MKKIFDYFFKNEFRERTNLLREKIRNIKTGIEVDDCWQEITALAQQYEITEHKEEVLSDLCAMLLAMQETI